MSQLSILALTENGLCLLQPRSTVTLSERKPVQRVILWRGSDLKYGHTWTL